MTPLEWFGWAVVVFLVCSILWLEWVRRKIRRDIDYLVRRFQETRPKREDDPSERMSHDQN